MELDLRPSLSIYSFFGKVAFAVTNSDFQLAAAVYDSYTWKKALFRLFLRSLRFEFAQKFFRQSSCFRGQDIQRASFSGELEYVLAHFGWSPTSVAVFFPPQAVRQRAYAHLFVGKVPLSFLKIHRGPEAATVVCRESKALEFFRSTRTSFRVPELLEILHAETFSVVVQQSLGSPPGLLGRPTLNELLALASELAFCGARAVSLEAFTKLPWWCRQLERLRGESPLFAAEIEGELSRAQSVQLTLVHGDIGVHNVRKVKNQLVVYDWEDASFDAPILADVLGVLLARNRNLRADYLLIECTAAPLLAQHAVTSGKLDFLLALAYQHALGRYSAGRLVKNWGG